MDSRYLKAALKEHLSQYRQMIFLVGPRQVGKTTLAKQFLKPVQEAFNYFNWDIVSQRKILTTQIFPGKMRFTSKQNPLVLDEIHKYRRWKNTLKGLFDQYEPATQWIITGSANLSVYRKGQDSLLGRYFSYHLCPFSVAELAAPSKGTSLDDLLEYDFEAPRKREQQALETLSLFGGFPEPLFKESVAFLKRWRNARLDRLINQDLAATENLRHLPLVENLLFLLPDRVGNPLSINSLRQDLEVHFETVKHWLELLERVYYGFRLPPYAKKKTRMLRKEKKWYLWDWSEIEDAGVRFENLVAVHLLKYVHYQNDLGHDDMSLHFIRDKEEREVDFLICKKKKPLLAIECKLKAQTPSKSLYYYKNKLNIPRALLITAEAIPPTRTGKGNVSVDVVAAAAFLKTLV